MYEYEIIDDAGEIIACGSCNGHNADMASEICYEEIDNCEMIYDCQRDRGEHGAWSYAIIAVIANEDTNTITMETVTVTITGKEIE